MLGDDLTAERTEELKISLIVPNEYQPRHTFDEESLGELANSIREHGVVQPILVRRKNHQYELIAGERRLRAAEMAGLKEIPAIVRDYSDKQSAEIALIENLQREGLTVIEEGEAYHRLMDEYGYTQEAMARAVGKSRSYLGNAVRFLSLTDEVKEFLLQHKVTAGQIRPILTLSSPAEQIRMARKIAEEGLSARQVEELLRRHKGEKKGKKNTSGDDGSSWIHDMEERLHTAMGTPVKIKFGKGKHASRGSISVSFTSEEEFKRLMAYLTGDTM